MITEIYFKEYLRVIQVNFLKDLGSLSTKWKLQYPCIRPWNFISIRHLITEISYEEYFNKLFFIIISTCYLALVFHQSMGNYFSINNADLKQSVFWQVIVFNKIIINKLQIHRNFMKTNNMLNESFEFIYCGKNARTGQPK